MMVRFWVLQGHSQGCKRCEKAEVPGLAKYWTICLDGVGSNVVVWICCRTLAGHWVVGRRCERMEALERQGQPATGRFKPGTEEGLNLRGILSAEDVRYGFCVCVGMFGGQRVCAGNVFDSLKADGSLLDNSETAWKPPRSLTRVGG